MESVTRKTEVMNDVNRRVTRYHPSVKGCLWATFGWIKSIPTVHIGLGECLQCNLCHHTLNGKRVLSSLILEAIMHQVRQNKIIQAVF
jgi:hypothetical protein